MEHERDAAKCHVRTLALFPGGTEPQATAPVFLCFPRPASLSASLVCPARWHRLHVCTPLYSWSPPVSATGPTTRSNLVDTLLHIHIRFILAVDSSSLALPRSSSCAAGRYYLFRTSPGTTSSRERLRELSTLLPSWVGHHPVWGIPFVPLGQSGSWFWGRAGTSDANTTVLDATTLQDRGRVPKTNGPPILARRALVF